MNRLQLVSAKRAMSPVRRKFYRELWQDTARRIGAECDHLGSEFYRIRRGDRTAILQRGEVPFDSAVAFKVAGDKPLLYRLYEEAGVAAPKHREFGPNELAAAETFRKEVGGRIVVKPARDTGGGEGVTTGIQSLLQLRDAARDALAFCPRLLAEEQIEGSSFRLLFLNGEMVDAVRRDPPVVTGDGATSIRDLVRRENVRRTSADQIVALSPLTIDLDMREAVRTVGLKLTSVLGRDQVVRLKTVVNQNSSSENHSVTDDVHPSIVEQSQKLVRYLALELAGVDVICRDIRLPLSHGNGVIAEINTGPGIHHHYLTVGKGAPGFVADQVLEALLARRKF